MDAFRSVLKQSIKTVEPINSNEYSTWEADYRLDFERYTEMNLEVIEQLSKIANDMNSAGHLRECVQVYKTVRKDFLESCFQQLRVQQLSRNMVSTMNREEIESRIADCIVAVDVCIAVLFVKEKQLCEKIFAGLPLETGARDPFTDTVEDFATQLFDFMEVVTSTPPSHENLMKILELHKTLSDLLPQVNDLFPDSGPLEPVRIQASRIVENISEVVKRVLSEFPGQVLSSIMSKTHPEEPVLPRYVMKNIMVPMICKYKTSLSTLISCKPSTDSDVVAKVGLVLVEETSPLSVLLMWILVNLVYNLLETSKSLYKETDATYYSFTMRNIGYIVEKIEWCTELKQAIRDDFVQSLGQKFHNAVNSYLKLTSDTIVKCLHVTMFNTKNALNENLGSFNALFDEMHRSLATIVVSDKPLRERYQNLVLERLEHAYKSFHKRLDSHQLAAKYSTEQLAAKIKNMFRDTPNPNTRW